MSAKDKRIERSQRFRRLRRGENRARAVSPIVATLILILIAVAAAAALYLWLVAWQGSVTGGIGSPTAQYTVTIGGSTSVYPFDQFAVTQFEQNNSNIVVSDNEGGSGAGMLAVCAGQVDIGTASAEETVSGASNSLESPISGGGYGCPASPAPTLTIVAYDAVDVIVQSANSHGLISVTAATLLTIYIANDGGYSDYLAAQPASQLPGGYAFPDVNAQSLGATTITGLEWSQIPACAPTTATTCAGEAETAVTVTAAGTGTGMATCGGGADICGTTTPCGYTVCAGPFGTSTGTAVAGAGLDVVLPWARADSSGTEQSFTARILGIGDSAGTTAGLGYTGCKPDGQLASCGINPPSAQLGTGNPAVITGVAGSADAIGFASDGLARASGSGVAFIPLEAVGQAAPVNPTTGGTGTIATGILGNLVTGYQGWRPFEYWTLGTPTGEVARFINFVMDPANNQAFANEAAEVSVYSI